MSGLLLLAMSAGALVTDAQRAETSVSLDDAVSQIWPVTQCLAENFPTEVEALLAKPKWGGGQTRSLTQLSERNANCGRIAPEAIDLDRAITRGLLAGAVFVAKHRSGAMLDYANAPSRVDLKRSFGPLGPGSMTSVRRLMEDAGRLTRDPMLGECTVTKSPLSVLKFLGSAPQSSDESASLAELSHTMGSCLFVKNGEQVNYSRPQLRRIFGEAGREMDYRMSVGSEVRH